MPETKRGGKNVNQLKNMCHRSVAGGYASLQRSQIVLPDVSPSHRGFWPCSGATAAWMIRPGGQGLLPISDGGYQNGEIQPAVHVTADTKWVSISAGGNDVHFGDLGKACASFVQQSGATLRGPIYVRDEVRRFTLISPLNCHDQIQNSKDLLVPLESTLIDLYKSILDRSPSAFVAVVGYPRVFSADTSKSIGGLCATNDFRVTVRRRLVGTLVGVRADDASVIETEIIQGLNRTASEVVNQLAADPRYLHRIRFVDTYNMVGSTPQDCTGHTVNPNVNGVMFDGSFSGTGPLGAISSATFHPTISGQTRMGLALQQVFESTQLLSSPGQISYAGQVGNTVHLTTAVSGGVGALVATVAAGGSGAPPWASISVDSAGQVSIDGTATTAGTWDFMVRIQDLHDQVTTIRAFITVTGPSTAGPVLLVGNGNPGSLGQDVDELAALLSTAGYTVTHTLSLPVDLSPYAQVWWMDYQGVSDAVYTELLNYSRAGGSLFLSGESDPPPSPYTSPSSDVNFGPMLGQLGALGQNGGAPTLGGFDPTSSFFVNSNAVGQIAQQPFVLTSFKGSITGFISPIPFQNVVAFDPSVAVAAAWDAVTGTRGRILVVLDLNWIDPLSRGTNWTDVAQNFALFLSGQQNPPGPVVPAP